MTALGHKLRRDLMHHVGPAVAVAAVTASGILAFVSMRGAALSIREARDGFYARARFADAFATVVRAPLGIVDDLAAIGGVATIDPRVAADVVLDVPGMEEPARGRLLSLPGGDGRKGLNLLALRRGRLPDVASATEAVASEAFAAAHGFVPGDTLAVIVNGRRMRVTLVGIAVSPEFIYTIPAGGVWPDDRRYGILWMQQRPLAALLGLSGAFNDVVFTWTPHASEERVRDAIERVLLPYGGRRVLLQREQLSFRFVDEELRQLDSQTFLVPIIFLGVAAFILHLVLVRLVDSQREIVGLLKAVGYSNATLVAHHAAFACVVVGVGAVFGIGGGAALGDQIVGLYRRYFRFDVLAWRMHGEVVLWAVVWSALAGIAGAFSATRRILRLAPAVAMQPPAPASYARRAVERSWMMRRLSVTSRMVVRQLWRRPVRAALTVVALSFAVAIVVVSSVFHDAITHLIDVNFLQSQREDVEVALVAPRPRREVTAALSRLPGVFVVEPTRVVPVELSNGNLRWEGVLEGRAATVSPSALRVPLDERERLRSPPWGEGIVLTEELAHRLKVAIGDGVVVTRRDADRQNAPVRVVGLSSDLLGLHAVASFDIVDGIFGERGIATGAVLLVDPKFMHALSARLKELSGVAGATFRMAALDTFRRLMAENMAVTRLLLAFFSSIIAVGIVYNNARIALSERQRELATLRVLGLSRRDVARVFLGEQVVLVLLGIPCGWVVGYGLTVLIATQAESSDIFRFPVIYRPATVLLGSAEVLCAAALTALFAKRRLDRLDLVAVLKSRE